MPNVECQKRSNDGEVIRRGFVERELMHIHVSRNTSAELPLVNGVTCLGRVHSITSVAILGLLLAVSGRGKGLQFHGQHERHTDFQERHNPLLIGGDHGKCPRLKAFWNSAQSVWLQSHLRRILDIGPDHKHCLSLS